MKVLSRLFHFQGGAHMRRIEEYLKENNVPYQLRHHDSPAYTAQELAHAEHVPGRMVAKVVIAYAEDRMVMLALPAPERVNLLKLAELLGTDNVRLATEEEFAGVFEDCEVGAMPPFGNLYGMPVLVDRALAQDERIVFPAGTHTDTIEMAYADFARLVHPKVADFGMVASRS